MYTVNAFLASDIVDIPPRLMRVRPGMALDCIRRETGASLPRDS